MVKPYQQDKSTNAAERRKRKKPESQDPLLNAALKRANDSVAQQIKPTRRQQQCERDVTRSEVYDKDAPLLPQAERLRSEIEVMRERAAAMAVEHKQELADYAATHDDAATKAKHNALFSVRRQLAGQISGKARVLKRLDMALAKQNHLLAQAQQATAAQNAQSSTDGAPALPPEVLALKELAERELGRRQLLRYVCRMVPGYMPGWVHEDICRRLEKFLDDVIAGKSPRLGLFMPPRHGKSQIASICFPSWALGKYPDLEFISCSYGIDLARDFSRKTKAMMATPEYEAIFPTRVDPNNASNEQWSVTNGRGAYVAAGAGGPITGKGANVLVIDDPVKNSEEAESAVIKDGIWDWYGSTAYTRLAPGGGVLIIQTLWADDDLAGRVMALMKEDPEADQFEIVKYPALAVEYEYRNPVTHELVTSGVILTEQEASARGLTLQRVPGDALHPARYDVARLNKIKRTLPARWWSALYQQDPAPDDGAYFQKDHFRRGPMPDVRHCNVLIGWDFAISEKQQNDYTVGTVALQDWNDVLTQVDVVRMKTGDGMKIADAMIALLQKWYRKSVIVKMGVEDGQIWRSIKSYFKKRLKEKRLYHFLSLVEELQPITDKRARAKPLQGRFEQGNYVFLENASWYETVEHEWKRFPAGKNDDTVDSGAWVAHMAMELEPPKQPKLKQFKSWRDKLGQYTAGGDKRNAMAA